MDPLGVAPWLFAAFAGFGLLIGLLFGFFGMGGSFLLTPALLVMGYPADVAVASGLAFVFATALVATLRHRDLGQVDYRLGGLMLAGTVAGLEVGKVGLLSLQAAGVADAVVSVVYVVLLGGIGSLVVRSARVDDGAGAAGTPLAGGDRSAAVARRIRSIRAPPRITTRGGGPVSLWVVLAVGFGTGVLSGFLGVGGGFVRTPALFALLRVPVPVAVGTDLFEIVLSGGIGSFLYAVEGAVDLSVVVPLLAGSTLGARLGAAATTVVDEREIRRYFGVTLLLGAVAVAIRTVGVAVEVPALTTVSLAIILGAALLVAGAVVVSAVRAVRAGAQQVGTGDVD